MPVRDAEVGCSLHGADPSTIAGAPLLRSCKRARRGTEAPPYRFSNTSAFWISRRAASSRIARRAASVSAAAQPR